MTRIAVIFPHPNGGNFSHFAHFICDFILPLYSLLRKLDLLDNLLGKKQIILELRDTPRTLLGPMLSLASALFPTLRVQYVAQFSLEPIGIHRCGWHNDTNDIQHFVGYLKQVLPIEPTKYGVIIVRRGMSRDKYPGGHNYFRSGADRRTIGSGLQELIKSVSKIRPDTICVELEKHALAEQVSLLLNADTLIAQHGASFVHAHWMPRGSSLIELQCCNFGLAPNFVPSIARLLDHKHTVVHYPCVKEDGRLIMTIEDPHKVSQLLKV